MKKFILLAALLIILTSCANSSKENNTEPDGTEKIGFYRGANKTFGAEYILFTEDQNLKFIDLSLNDMTAYPLCSKPNCKHDQSEGLCAAFALSEAKYPFIYNNKLYYFMFISGDFGEQPEGGLYQADTDGTNQKLIFKADDNFFFLFEVYFWNGKLFFTAAEAKPNEYGGFSLSGPGINMRIYVYDFEEVSLILETGLIYDGGINLKGIIEDSLFIEYMGRDYEIDIPPEEIYEYVSDKNSIYWQDYVWETRKMSIVQKTPLYPIYEVVKTENPIITFKDCYYYISSSGLSVLQVNIKTNKTNEIFTAHDTYLYSLKVFDDKLFIMTMGIEGDMKSGNYRYIGNLQGSYYDGSKLTRIGSAGEEMKVSIQFESNDYFFGYVSDISDEIIRVYIPKSDFYSGNWNGITESDW